MCAVRACDCRGAKTRAEGAPGDDSPRTLGFGTCQRTRHIGYRGGRIFCPAEADLSSCDRGSRTIVWRISQTILENAKTEKLPRAERFPRPIHGRHKRARITARIRTRAELVVESRSRLLERSSEPRLRLRTHPPSRSPTIEQNGHPRHAPPSLRAPRTRARLALLRPVRPRAIPPSPARRSHRFVQSRSIRSRGDAIASARAEPSLPGAVHHRTTRPRRARARSRGADEDLPPRPTLAAPPPFDATPRLRASRATAASSCACLRRSSTPRRRRPARTWCVPGCVTHTSPYYLPTYLSARTGEPPNDPGSRTLLPLLGLCSRRRRDRSRGASLTIPRRAR